MTSVMTHVHSYTYSILFDLSLGVYSYVTRCFDFSAIAIGGKVCWGKLLGISDYSPILPNFTRAKVSLYMHGG